MKFGEIDSVNSTHDTIFSISELSKSSSDDNDNQTTVIPIPGSQNVSKSLCSTKSSIVHFVLSIRFAGTVDERLTRHVLDVIWLDIVEHFVNTKTVKCYKFSHSLNL